MWGSIVVQVIAIHYLAILIPFYLVILALMFYYTSSIISKLRKKEYISKSPILTFVASALEGLTTIRTQKLQEKVLGDLLKQLNEYYRCYVTNQSYMRFTQLYSEIFGLLIAMINVILILKTDNLVGFTMAAYSLACSLNSVSSSSIATKDLLELHSLMFSPQHLLEYCDLEQEKIKKSENFSLSSGKIEFKGTCFQYQPHLPVVLKDLNFFINAGEKVGVVGRTGSGKSSLLHLLCRLTEPLSGTVLLDGQDYRSFGLHELRRQISVIPQNSVLFSTSLRDNLDPLQLFTDKQIWKVLELVGLSYIFAGSDEALDSELGNEGVKLSAGQKQLVCIARAVLNKNKIVLLDEATSNIDLKTDECIQDIMKCQFKKSTLIVIAHRILTAADSDRIIVMDSGKCVEFDTPDNLYQKKDGVFRKLASTAGLKRKHFIRTNQ
jgi:ABC-type multidrug transport system fused ATPase/permease subunit